VTEEPVTFLLGQHRALVAVNFASGGTRACMSAASRTARPALTGRELRALRRHQRECWRLPFVFVSERGAPLSALA